jgi:hypothetical protein
MKTFNSEANMKTRTCFSPRRSLSGRSAELHSALRLRMANAILLCLLWLALPSSSLAQPANYTNDTVVANYVKSLLYWSTDPAGTSAAFRYKTLLYTNANDPAPALASMASLYGAAERSRAQTAEAYLRRALTNSPASTLLAGLLLDLYYDRAAAEFILSANSLTGADRARMGPPSVPTGFVIDDEISLYRQALTAYRTALMTNFALLVDNLGMSDVPPAGCQWFQQLVPSRSLDPAYCLSSGVSVPVTGDAAPLFTGYKDLVLLFNGLRDYGRAAVSLARLQMSRNNAGDLDQAKSLIADSMRFLFLQSSKLLAVFPGLDPHDTNAVDAASGLAAAVDAVNESQLQLETMRQSLLAGANLLGFEGDFLMLVQKFVGQSGNVFDSFDSFQLKLDPGQLSSPLAYAQSLLTDERNSYDQYRGAEDQLDLQMENVNQSAEDRLFQIVGAHPGTPAYAHPENNAGSEIAQQLNSLQAAQLRIKRNRVERENLDQQIEIARLKAIRLNTAWVQYGNEQAELTAEIEQYKMAQVAAEKLSDAWGTFGEVILNPFKLITVESKLVNAVGQTVLEGKISNLEVQKEKLEASQNGQVAIIEGQADINTLRLNYNTLAVDSQEALVLMSQEVGRLAALLREKADLECTLAENQQNLAGRYFADPIHHLRYQHQTMLAHLSFYEAQKWLYFMARALEYKWNTPFMNYSYMGKRWSTSTLFKLRNAEELTQFYNAMVSFNSLVQLPSDDYYDWFSVREDFFGYKMYDPTGTNLAYYADPNNPGGPTNLTAIQAFRQKLRGLADSQGNINLSFSTVREKPGHTFFRGPRFDANLQTVLSAGLFLDKIKWIKINLPGTNSLHGDLLAGQLTYGGNSFVRNFDVGQFVPGHPDRMTNEMTAYSTRYWFFHAPTASWEFSEALTSPVTMTLTNNSQVPPSVGQIEVFKERSVATTGWQLTIPTQDLGVPVLKIDDLNDVELQFYHYAVSREMASGLVAAPGQKAATPNIPFPYYLKYHSNPEADGK